MKAASSVVFTLCMFGAIKASISWGIFSSGNSSQAMGEGPWNLQHVFADKPPGAYLEFMKPLIYANYLAYKTSPGPKQDVFISQKRATITEEYSGGRIWERFHQVEIDGEQRGPYMRVFVDQRGRRAILAFRGKCSDKLNPVCRSEMHMGERGNPSFGDNVGIATKLVINAKKHLDKIASDYAILVTGHAYGAELASWACKRSKVNCQVVGLAGGLKSQGPPVKDSFVLFDPIDLGMPAKTRNHLTVGAKTLCVYDIPPPRSCNECVRESHVVRASDYLELQKCKTAPAPLGHWESLCSYDTHWLEHWIKDILPQKNLHNPLLPKCTTFSTISPSGLSMSTK